jgi:hypothetical protein
VWGAPKQSKARYGVKIPPRPSRRKAPVALLAKSRPPKKSFVFHLEDKIGRAQIQNGEKNFSLSERVSTSGGGAERQNSAFGFSRKKVRISFSVRSIRNRKFFV